MSESALVIVIAITYFVAGLLVGKALAKRKRDAKGRYR